MHEEGTCNGTWGIFQQNFDLTSSSYHHWFRLQALEGLDKSTPATTDLHALLLYFLTGHSG